MWGQPSWGKGKSSEGNVQTMATMLLRSDAPGNGESSGKQGNVQSMATMLLSSIGAPAKDKGWGKKGYQGWQGGGDTGGDQGMAKKMLTAYTASGGKGSAAKGKKGSAAKGKKGAKSAKAPAGAAGTTAKARTNLNAQGEPMGWKSRLYQAYSLKHKGPPTKDSIVFECVQGEKAGEGGFVFCISSDQFSDMYVTPEPESTKKLATEMAAMLALQFEFPEYWEKSVSEDVKEAGAAAFVKDEGEAPKAPPAKKAKIAEAETQSHDNPKNNFYNGLNLIHARPMTKADVEYSYAESAGTTIATVTLKCMGEWHNQAFTGKPSAGTGKDAKKKADILAAEAALAALQPAIDKAKAAQLERRKEKAESEAKLGAKKA